MRAVVLLPLLAACSVETTYAVTIDDAEKLGRARTISVAAHQAAAVIRSGPPGRIEASVRYRGAAAEPALTLVTKGDDGGTILVQLAGELSRREGSALTVTAPAGMELHIVGADAAVEIHGEWSRVDASTGEGAISAHVDRLDRGELRSHAGAVALVAKGRGPAGEVTARSTSGDVSVTLPAAWKGQLKFQTQTGKLDVPPHKNLETIWDAGDKGVVGRMGPALEPGMKPPTVWGLSGSGSVSFRVGE